jgi:anaerobic selenocysteine-containing dehydrogenase
MLVNGPRARVRDLRTILGQAPTAALADEILEPGEGQIRALVTVGGNPVLAWPDQVRTIRALEALDTHVALDIRVSATARLAHYVIPSQLSLERPDVPTNIDTWFEQPYTIYAPALLRPGRELVDEAGLYVELARRMGVTIPLAGGDVTPDDRLTPDELLERCYPHVRVPWDELRATEGGRLRDELTTVVQPPDPDCTARFDVAPELALAELAVLRDAPDGYGDLAGYDPHVHTHRMASRRLKGVFNSSGREIEALRAKEGTSYAHAHPDDLARWGVQDGDLVEIASPRGAVRTLVKAAPDVRPGTVSMAHAWGDLPGEAGPPADPGVLGDTTGRLSDCASGYDRVTGLPVMSAIPVSVRPV